MHAHNENANLVHLGAKGSAAAYPAVGIAELDTLWFQVAGTLCNLKCSHCFISCSPTNHTHRMMHLEDVLPFLREAETLGVKEYYFTGGEPFMNRDMLRILEATLAQGPASVLTNGTLLRPQLAQKLYALSQQSEYSLDLRISLDGWSAETNDPIRGEHSFARILAGIRALADAGLHPVITITEACEGAASRQGRRQFLAFMEDIGLKSRLKVLPLLRMGAEEDRERGYHQWESLAGVHLDDAQKKALQCGHSRMVCAQGVYVCPILINEPGAKMGRTLTETLRPFSLSHPACYTCHMEGLTCAT